MCECVYKYECVCVNYRNYIHIYMMDDWSPQSGPQTVDPRRPLQRYYMYIIILHCIVHV